MDDARIRTLANDTEFQAVLTAVGDGLTRKVMAEGTSEEARQQALAEYRALGRIKATLTSWGQQKPKE